MADFSYLSDTDESAVEELISQAQDLCVLEQVSAINCASFSDSSLLPTDLESRFRKLKSFPLTGPRPKHSTPPPYTKNDFNNNEDNSTKADGLSVSGKQEDAAVFSHSKRGRDEKLGSRPRSPPGYDSLSRGSSDFSQENEAFPPSKENPNGKRGSGTNMKRGSISSPSNSSDSSLENLISSTSKRGPDEKRRTKLKPQPGLFSSPVGSSNSFSLRDSPSPPKKIGCFWCSPKKAHNNSKENHATGINLDWGKNDEYLSASSSFSTKQQQKMLKKAMKEEEKISREAEKIVKWAKQASARLSVSGIEDKLSDD